MSLARRATYGGAKTSPQLNLTQVASDSFTRANGAIAGSNNWLAISTGGMSVSSNEALGVAGVITGNYRTGESYSGNQYAKCVVGSVPLVSGGFIGPTVRNTDNQHCYALLYYQNGTGLWETDIYKCVAGTWTQLIRVAQGAALAQGTALELVTEGSQVTAYVGGAALMSITDTSVPAGGTPGIVSFDANTLDNWEGGNALTGAVGIAQASDNFAVGTNVSTDGQAWSIMNYPASPATTDIPISAGQLSVQNPPITSHAGDVRTDTFASDHWASIQMGTTPTNGTGFLMASGRNQGTGATLGNSAYIGGVFQNFSYNIYRLDNGASTQIGTVHSLGNDPQGTEYMLVCQGSRISLRVNGKEVMAVTDATYTGGAPGVMMFANATGDNWSGGNV